MRALTRSLLVALTLLATAALADEEKEPAAKTEDGARADDSAKAEDAAEDKAEGKAKAAPAPKEGLAARSTAFVGPKGSWSVGVFNPLRIAVHDRVELEANPLLFFVAPHVTSRFGLLEDGRVRVAGELGLLVPTFGMRLLKGYFFPTWATSKNDIGWMVVPRAGLVVSGGEPLGDVWTGTLDFSARVPFGPVNAGPLNSFLAPLDLLFAAPLTGYSTRLGVAYDKALTTRFRLRGEANVHLTGTQGGLFTDGTDVGPLASLSQWYLTAHLGLDIRVGKMSRFTVGCYFANYDQGATAVVTGADGFAERVRVRSNNFLPTIDFIWAG